MARLNAKRLSYFNSQLLAAADLGSLAISELADSSAVLRVAQHDPERPSVPRARLFAGIQHVAVGIKMQGAIFRLAFKFPRITSCNHCSLLICGSPCAGPRREINHDKGCRNATIGASVPLAFRSLPSVRQMPSHAIS